MGKKKKQKQARPIVTDVSAVKNSAGDYVVSRSYAEVVDLISEGVIEGLVSGGYIYDGDFSKVSQGETVTGYESVSFDHYTATGDAGTDLNSLGFLRSVYWNEIPIVDKDGFYNFPYVNLQKVEGGPIGTIPRLNESMDTYAGVTSGEILDLTINRPVGERLYGPEIEGGDASPTSVKQSRLKAGIAIDKYAKTYTVLNKEIQKILVNIKIATLFENVQAGPKTYKKSKHLKKCNKASTGFGDTKARTIEYNIYYRPIYDQRFNPSTSSTVAKSAINVSWSAPIKERVTGKVDQPYIRSTPIDLSQFDYMDQEGFEGWEIRIVRITPEPVTSYYRATSFVDTIVEVFGTKLRYPYSSMIYSQFDARSFSRVPARAYDTNLIKVKIPNNYNPFLKTYGKSSASVGTMQGSDGSKISDGDRTNSSCVGVNSWAKRSVIDPEWDGGFATVDGSADAQPVKVWTDNPAWCFYDLMTNPRYGLGDSIEESQIDKWALYEIAQHCDELVEDTYGGLEPRFTMNYLITSREEAFKVLNDLTSIFRGIAYFANGSIFAVQDKYKLPVYQFNNSNVSGGNFTYSSSSKKARHSIAIVRYNDKRNFFQPAIEYLEDEESVRRYGIKEIETSALGATSRGQARRFAKWILQSESLETETVSFSMGQDGAYVQPGDVIQIYDNFRSPLKYSGRTNAVIKGIPAITNEYNPSTQDVATQRNNPYSDKSNFNTVILDQALGFHPDKVYKFSMLTPTYNTVTGDSSEEVRRSQIQTGLFKGSDTQLTTGNHQNNLGFRSDLSGQCTEITFNTGNDYGGMQNSFDFDNYVITGYTNTGVWTSGPLQNMGTSQQGYSGGCFSGENLVWSIEPNNADDPEFISGSYSNYKIINVKEDEDIYSISALAYSTGKYDEVDASTAVTTASKIKPPLFPTGNTASNTTILNSQNTPIDPILNVIQSKAYQADELKTAYGTVEIEFAVAGYSMVKFEDDTSNGVPYRINDVRQPELNITYAIAIITDQGGGDSIINSDEKPTTDDQIRTIKPSRYSIYSPYIVENIPNLKILGTDTSGNSISNKRRSISRLFQDDTVSKIHGEYLINPNASIYYVVVFALSETSTLSQGIIRRLSLENREDMINSDVETVSITSLTSEGLTAAAGLQPLESVEPGFTWSVSSEGIYSTAGSVGTPNNDPAPYFEIPISNQDREYRITVRRVDSSQPDNNTSINKPSEYIYLELTGYNVQSETSNFVLQKFYNDPGAITGYRDDAHVTGWTNGIVTDKDKAEWLSVSGSGFNIRNNPEEFPVREFDIVVEAHDSNGNTSAGNKIWRNTILGTTEPKESFDTSKSNYDIFGGKIESPSGVFFAQDIGSNPKALGLSYNFLDSQKAFDLEYPYVAAADVYPNGYLELKFTHATNQDPALGPVGKNRLTDNEIDIFFNNTAGLIYYYTTGDNSVEFIKNEDGITSSPRLKNPAPQFVIDSEKLKDTNNKGVQSLMTAPTFNADGQVTSDATAFGGVVNLRGHRGLVVQVGDQEQVILPIVHRGYYLFNDSDSFESLRIPFPNINLATVENIQLSYAYFDDLHLLSSFEEDEETPIISNEDESNGINTLKIFTENSLNYSTAVKGAGPESFEGDQFTYPNTMVNAPNQSLFLNENSVSSAGDTALAFRAWGEVWFNLKYFHTSNAQKTVTTAYKNTFFPQEGSDNTRFLCRFASKNINAAEVITMFVPLGKKHPFNKDVILKDKNYYIAIKVSGMQVAEPNKMAVMLAPSDTRGKISYGWGEGQESDKLIIKIDYGNALPDFGENDYFQKQTFGILMTNE